MPENLSPIDDEATNSRQLDHLMRNTLAKVCALLEMEAVHASGPCQQRLRVSLARVRSMAIAHNLIQQSSGKSVNACIMARAIIDGVSLIYSLRGMTLEVDCPAFIPCSAWKIADLAQVLTEISVHLVGCRVSGKASTTARIILCEENGELILLLPTVPAAILEHPATSCIRCAGNCWSAPLSMPSVDGLL